MSMIGLTVLGLGALFDESSKPKPSRYNTPIDERIRNRIVVDMCRQKRTLAEYTEWLQSGPEPEDMQFVLEVIQDCKVSLATLEQELKEHNERRPLA